MSKRIYCIFGTATTGRAASMSQGNRLARIVDVGCAVVTLEGEEIEVHATFDSLVNPGEEHFRPSWANQALSVNGVSRESIEKAPSTELVSQNLKDFLRDWQDKPNFSAGAYDTPFDFDSQFLLSRDWLARWNVEHQPRLVDVAAVYRSFRLMDKYTKGWRLDDACADLGIVRAGSHRALIDAIDASKVLAKVLHLWAQPGGDARRNAAIESGR